MKQVDVIDISHWQSDNYLFDPNKTKAALPNLKGIIIKATQGKDLIDGRLLGNYSCAKLLNVPIGFYHYINSTIDGAKQAEHFLTTIDSLSKIHSIRKIIPAIDIEEDKIHSPDKLNEIISDFIEYCHLNGIPKLLFYSGMSFIKFNLGNPANFVNNPLWLAFYSNLNPQDHKWFPTKWEHNFALWQFAAQKIAGFAGDVDVNQINPAFDFNSLIYT
jgi:lysozyme